MRSGSVREFCWCSGKKRALSDCANVAVTLFPARSVTSYCVLFGLDVYYLFCYF